jgi:putative aldouronate transport system permease protein
MSVVNFPQALLHGMVVTPKLQLISDPVIPLVNRLSKEAPPVKQSDLPSTPRLNRDTSDQSVTNTVAALRPPAAARMTRGAATRRYLRRNGTWMLMALPGIILVFIFSYLPMFGVIIAFKNYRPRDGILGSEWVGLKNFQYLFNTSATWRALYNTISMNLLFIVTGTLAALALGLLLYEIHARHRWLMNFAQSTMLLPYVLSWVVVRSFSYALLNANNGWVNNLLVAIGLAPVRWFSEPDYWPLVLTIVNIWKSVGIGAIIYLAGMLAINPELYEVATIDGANRRQQIRYITLPLLLPLVVINVLLALGGIIRADFGLFYHVTQNAPALYKTTDVLDTLVYRALLTTNDIGMASAASFLQSVVGLVMVFAANWIVRRISDEKALF